MDFFAQQAKARSASKRLIVLFGFAVVTIVVAIGVVVAFAMELAAEDEPFTAAGSLFDRHATAIAISAVITLLVIAVASLFKTGKLRSGGGAVAREMGATLVPSDATSPAYRRLRNVVEEIAIASGTPVPEIYVLEHESSINAFAAGFTPSDAAVAVTRGALERLSRDELQGVIAHEFSHILNGDMRLNIRLMGVLFGILVIGIVAREFLRHSRGGRDRNGGALVLAALGIMVIGYIGLFFGRLIKAGVSRQREYLADASAVQFTRQSSGIAGALKKIGGLAQGSRLESTDAEEVSHMLFGDGVGYSALFATHPPLLERIRRIEPRFDPREFNELAKALARPASANELAEAEAMGPIAPLHPLGVAAPLPSARAELAITPAAVVAQVANPAADDYRAAGQLAVRIPEPLREAAHREDHAPALVIALALGRDPALRERQLAEIQDLLTDGRRELADAFHAQVAALHPMQRLPLAAMVFPALRRRPRDYLERLVQALDRVIRADGTVGLDEYCLARLVGAQVAEAIDPARARMVGRRRLADCRLEIGVLFAVLARHGHDNPDAARRAFLAGMHGVLPDRAPEFVVPKDWVVALDAALPALDRLNPPSKQLLVEGLTACMSHDGRIAVAEAELLRTVCAVLHCPLPPMLSQVA